MQHQTLAPVGVGLGGGVGAGVGVERGVWWGDCVEASPRTPPRHIRGTKIRPKKARRSVVRFVLEAAPLTEVVTCNEATWSALLQKHLYNFDSVPSEMRSSELRHQVMYLDTTSTLLSQEHFLRQTSRNVKLHFFLFFVQMKPICKGKNSSVQGS